MAAPTRVSYNAPSSGNYSGATSPKTTTSFDVVAGDLIIVLCSVENAGLQSVVTPSATGGSVTWTQRVRQPAANNGNTSAAWCWTGTVGATATGITVSLARPTTDTALWWGMSATVYRDHGGVGQVFSGTNGTGANSAPSVGVSCSANSAVVCVVNDWNAADGTSRTWRTINGAAETETIYFRDAAHHAAYGGYRADTGAAGTITQGLTAPTGQRWVLAGVEILASAGLSASPADSFGITDSAAAVADRVRTQDDPLGLTDSAQTATAFDRSAGDPVGLTDSVQVSSGASVTEDDPVGIADAVALSRSVNLADSVGATDSAATIIGASVTDDDPVGVTDNVTVALSIARTIGDSIGVTDSASVDLTSPGSAEINDPLGVTDLLTATAQILRTAADNLGITDGLTAALSKSSTPADPVGVTDSVTVQAGAAPSPADGVGVTDSAVAVLSRVVTIADQVAGTDSVASLNPSVPQPTQHLGTHREAGNLGSWASGNLGIHRESANLT